MYFRREQLVFRNIGLAAKYVQRYGFNRFDQRWEDLFCAGLLGLVEAADRYDFENYAADEFHRYAGWWIKKEISEELYGTNPRARNKIKTTALVGDPSATQIPIIDESHRKDMWSRWIRLMLERYKITIRDLAKRTGINPSSMYEYYHGQKIPSRETQKKILKFVVDEDL